MKISHIHIIPPIITRGIRSEDDTKPYLRDDLKVTYSLLDIGPATIESAVDEALAVPGAIAKAIAVEKMVPMQSSSIVWKILD